MFKQESVLQRFKMSLHLSKGAQMIKTLTAAHGPVLCECPLSSLLQLQRRHLTVQLVHEALVHRLAVGLLPLGLCGQEDVELGARWTGGGNGRRRTLTTAEDARPPHHGQRLTEAPVLCGQRSEVTSVCAQGGVV